MVRLQSQIHFLTCSGTGLAATWDKVLIREIGGLLSRESKAKGASVVLAPTVNILRSPLNGRVG